MLSAAAHRWSTEGEQLIVVVPSMSEPTPTQATSTDTSFAQRCCENNEDAECGDHDGESGSDVAEAEQPVVGLTGCFELTDEGGTSRGRWARPSAEQKRAVREGCEQSGVGADVTKRASLLPRRPGDSHDGSRCCVVARLDEVSRTQHDRVSVIRAKPKARSSTGA